MGDLGEFLIDGNNINYASQNGIFYGYGCVDGTISNNIISNTSIYNGDSGGIYTAGEVSSNVVITTNTFTNAGYGIYFDEVSDGGIVEHNIVNGGKMALLLHRAKNITSRYNKFVGPFAAGYAVDINSSNTQPIGNTLAYNIIDGVDKSCSGIIILGNSSLVNSLINIQNNDIVNCDKGVYVYSGYTYIINNLNNNIFYNNTTHIDAGTGYAVSTDYNLFGGTGNWISGGATKATFDLWKTASSGDSHSLNVNPLFISSSDYHLQSGSPAKDAGIYVGLTTDYDGNTSKNPPSIGAYEYGSLVTSPVIPVYQSSVVENATPSLLEMTYNLTLANIAPAASAFSVRVNSVGRTINIVTISGKKVLLTLSSPVVYGNVVTVSYTKPSSNLLQSTSTGIAANISNQPVVNNCINVAPPNVNQPPVVTISNPSKGSKYENLSTITIDAVASDPDGTIVKVEFYNGSEKLVELTSPPYSFTWKDVEAGIYSITAIATDNLNATTTSSPVEFAVGANIKYDANSEIINLYPNPNDGHFSIELFNSIQNEIGKITISDLSGKLIYQGTLLKDETIKQIDLSYIKSGIYLLMIIYNRIIVVKKFIKL
jgi:uncharacterized repeat protein (TIGR02059 family)